MFLLTGRPPRQFATIFTDITHRKQAEAELKSLNETLEQRVLKRTREVRQQAANLRAMTMQLSQAEQRERRRLAHVLHDHIQQLLVAARMRLQLLRQDGRERRELQAETEKIDGIMQEAVEATRSLTLELVPPCLYEAGFGEALKWLASSMYEKSQFTVALELESRVEPVSEETRVLLFDCIRELLFNALKHSGVTEARVSVTRTADNRLKVTVQDQGKGFSPGWLQNRLSDQASFGLFSIQQRLNHIGGEMEIDSDPGKGTVIILVAPID